MRIHAIICTRDRDFSEISNKLFKKLASLPATVKVMTKQQSIFSGYKDAFESLDPDDEDLVILCHDDLELPQNNEQILNALKLIRRDGFGFGGVAGTKLLGQNAVWWDQDLWQKGYHSGFVYHKDPEKGYYATEYGPCSKVVVLDGCFLVAKASVLRDVGLSKPNYLEGDWDFYDLHYTMEAHKKGYSNITIPLIIAHHSSGELVGRDGWNENRQRFIEYNSLPVSV